MKAASAAERHANQVTQLLDTVLGADRYPVNVAEVAQQVSRARFPKESIEQVIGRDLPGFDGAIVKMGAGRGWAIIYNDRIRSPGRINFTLAHEFGHYLVHREKYPAGLSCGAADIVRQDSAYKLVEVEANTFAAYLLMPFHDFRHQIAADARPSWEELSACAKRYNVSLVAATLRWLEYTTIRAALIVSRDGFVDWGKSSRKAYVSGRYFSKSTVTPVPGASPASCENLVAGRLEPVHHPPGVWFEEAVTECVIRSDAYDFSMSLLLLESGTRMFRSDEDEVEPDVGDMLRDRDRQ